ncbi:putative bifunctional diguanylate cyclase/phosphodiesterase [Qipengyuania sediminis]|uniref:putative bifunctional diguanylate cyclase/phosphodiesterase n=1 Tax=Qipengyuania sediminis TaxID=1532023 RepID=UPI0010598579|nr:EAL domain-containing protein [Qipengyuania sediminis]
MGAMPFSELFKSRKPHVGGVGEGAVQGSSTIGPAAPDRAAIVADLENAGISWFWATDAAGQVSYLSEAIARACGHEGTCASGVTLQSLLIPVAGEGDGRSLGLKLGTRKPFSGLLVETTGGEPANRLVLRLSGRAVFDAAGGFIGFRGSALDATEEYRNEEEASRLAQFDSLTGLSNRHRMGQRIEATLAAFRQTKRAATLFMLDLDRFKQVNDTLGHAAGDELLQQVGDRLRGAVAGRGEIGRLGGDEFQVLIPDVDDRGELGVLARKIIAMLSQPYSLSDGRCTIGCSVGVAIAPYDGVEREELERAADLALYASKNGGRGQFRFYAADLELEDQLRRRMESDLADAIEAGSFALEYEPLVSLADNRVVALEARYCWEDEERGRVSPESFLPIAEGSRLIVPIGEWALMRACRDARQWPATVRLAIPVSPVQFFASGFADRVAAVLEETEFDPARLELQLCEAIIQGDAAMVDKGLGALFKLGVRLTLDHFGRGFTSLSYLRRAPFSSLRVAPNFFEPTIGDELGDMEMIGAIVQLARTLGMETSAGGIHALPLLARLQALGIDHVGGYVFGEPMSADAVEIAFLQGDWTIAPSDAGSQRASRRTVFRKIGLIHTDCYYEVTLRNLSRSGAMIQGLEDVPVGTQFVLDFGGGQLAVATVKRVMDDTQGVEFEQELVDDGAGGLVTRGRVSPYALANAGLPLQSLGAGKVAGAPEAGVPRFKLSRNAPRPAGIAA